MVSRLIVKPRYRSGDQLNEALRIRDASRLANISRVRMSVVRPMSGNAHVVHLEQPVTLSEARVIAARLMRDDSVELAEPDRLMRPLLIPTDPNYGTRQWNLQTRSTSNLGTSNLPNAWDLTTGNNTVTVAVIDTGYRPHVDLGTVVQGYDFIIDVGTANDGNGRDTDAQDPGDWITAAENASGPFKDCDASNSSWHGTHVAGIIAARMSNGLGIAGIAPNIQILPVRVLGKCGGFTSDIVDGMRWAAGIAVSGTPTNTYPARVLNMSLGSSGNCSASFQSAVTDVVNAGAVVVAATGNDGSSSVGAPANCTGVIAVTANGIDGDNSWYATIGTQTAISAPGGGCGGMLYPNGCTAANSPGVYSLVNTGTTVPISDTGYASYQGTSMATPHVTSVIALMLSLNPALTPAQIKSYLQSTARPHPSNTVCTTFAKGLCGAGILDAYQALYAVNTGLLPPLVTLGTIPYVVTPGTSVTLSGSGVPKAGNNIVSYVWTQLSGAVVSINNANSSTASFTAPATGTYSFKLTATDDQGLGLTGTANTTVHVNSAPVLNVVAAQTVVAGQALNFTVTATDADGDTPIFNSVTLPSGATLSATGNFSWPTAIPSGNYTMTYYASDDYANSSQGTVNITVTAPVTIASTNTGTSSAATSGGGGGSMDSGFLLIITLLAIALRIRRAKQSS